ncbi:MAG: hypothetical protein Q9160_007179 [Pyrenula sp. 1 TL-2023]
MAPSDDLRAHATSSTDFYELLSLLPTATETEIRRAYRKTSLKYHPDKVGATPENLEKFHLLQIAQDVLSDPAVRALYDQSREAKERRKREEVQLEGKRRKMKEDLERRESGGFGFTVGQAAGVKRRWGEESADEKLAREIERIAENNRRMVRQMKEERERKQQREALEEEEIRDQELQRQNEQNGQPADAPKNGYGKGGSNVPEIERTVKVRLIREGAGREIDKDRLADMFGTFGKVENAFLLKDKKQRLEGQKEKRIFATGVVVFASIVGAHAAVEDAARETMVPWEAVESVRWAEDKGADFTSRPNTPSRGENNLPLPSTPASTTKASQFFAGLNKKGKADATNNDGLRKVPSFASFSSAAFNTPKGSPVNKNAGVNSPSLEELTMMKLKNKQREIERKRLEEELRSQDEDAKSDNAEV